MKTRIIHTKIWQDDWFSSLSRATSIIYLYLLTCPENNLSGFFELSDRVISFNTNTNQAEISQAKEDLKNKVGFYKGWVKIFNSDKYQSYNGPKNEIAKENELKLIPPDVIHTLSIGYVYPTDRTINHKSEIINKKSETKESKGMQSLDEEYMREVAKNLNISYELVLNKKIDLELYCKSTGKKYKNYKATLLSWVRKEIDADKNKRR